MNRKKVTAIINDDAPIEDRKFGKVQLVRLDVYNFALAREQTAPPTTKVNGVEVPNPDAGKITLVPFLFYGSNLKLAALACLKYQTVGTGIQELLKSLAQAERNVLKALAEIKATQVSHDLLEENDDHPGDQNPTKTVKRPRGRKPGTDKNPETKPKVSSRRSVKRSPRSK